MTREHFEADQKKFRDAVTELATELGRQQDDLFDEKVVTNHHFTAVSVTSEAKTQED